MNIELQHSEPALSAATMQILLVEDDEGHSELIERAFRNRQSQMNLRTARCIREAREILEQEELHLMITDLVLPDGHGIELVSQAASCPVVVMTSHGDEQIAVKAMKAGALDYVVKSPQAFQDMPRTAERALREWAQIHACEEAERALQHKETLLRSIMNATPAAWYVVNSRDDRVLYFNRHFCKLWGLEHLEESMTRGERTDSNILSHCLNQVADVSSFIEASQALEGDTAVEDEILFQDGRTIRRFSAPVRNDGDEYLGRLHLFEDVTERKRRESEARQRAAAEARLEALSPREREVMDRVVEGDANKVIANKLGISIKTVEMHRSNVMKKLNVDSMASLMRLAILADNHREFPT